MSAGRDKVVGLPRIRVPSTNVAGDTTSADLSSSTRWRADVQGLRGIAVLLVVAFHLPGQLISGGYIGVDVFFVISGFLIGGHLLDEVLATGRLRLARFWSRRIRRLIPAAVVVLLFCLAILPLLARTTWVESLRQIAASTVYIQNWYLSQQAVDYMAQDSAATVVQHYWSLAVEEQFYIFLPLVVAAVMWLLRWCAVSVSPRLDRLHSRRSSTTQGARDSSPQTPPHELPQRRILIVLGVTLLVLFVSSLAYAIFATTELPSQSYFSTWTRAWEFLLGAIGALVVRLTKTRKRRASRDTAVAARRSHVSQAGVNSTSVQLLQILGLTVIVACAWYFDDETNVPGVIALLPTVAALAVLLAPEFFVAVEHRPKTVLTSRFLVRAGDLSYAIYLWHWPLIVLAKTFSHEGSLLSSVIVVCTTWLFAQITATLVENRLRFGPLLRGVKRPLAFAVFVAVFLGGGSGVAASRLASSDDAARPRIALSRLAEARVPECVGPQALLDSSGCDPTGQGEYLLSLQAVARQNQDRAFSQCQQDAQAAGVESCVLGYRGSDPALTIAVFGDSHATHWLSGFDVLGQQRHWRVVSFTRSSCPPSLARRVLSEEETSQKQRLCSQWVHDVLDEVTANREIDAVVMAGFGTRYDWLPAADSEDAGEVASVGEGHDGSATGVEEGDATNNSDSARDGVITVIDELLSANKKVAVIRSIPTPQVSSVPDCLATYGRTDHTCGIDRAVFDERSDPIYQAARERIDQISLVDLTDQFCDENYCYPVVGDIVVYRDGSHLSREYAAALMPYLVDDVPWLR